MLQRRRLIPASNYFEWGWSDNDPQVDNNSHDDVQTGMGLRQNANNRQRIKYAIWPKENYAANSENNSNQAGNKSSLFYLAGIYHLENHGGTLIPYFTILTQCASENIAFIHDRMPFILPHDFLAAWLNPKANAEDIITNAEKMMEYRAV